jgi:hypothetical protein
MYTHGCATRHALVSRLVVIIHYETISICYLGTICFCYVRSFVGASSVMVSWLMTYGAAAKLRTSCECAHRTVLLVGCWYQGLWSWSIVELHWCVIFRGLLPWNNFYVVCRSDQATSIISVGSKRAYPFHVWSLFLDLDSDYLYKFLYVLCVKVKPRSFLVLENNWLALKMKICFPCCWNAGVCSFALLFNPCIPGPSRFISHQPLAYRWYWEDLLKVKSSSTSWFY